MDLLIISHTPHYRQNGQIVGWGPTVREIDHLATLFDRVKHLAVLYDEAPPLSSLPYTARNISLIPVRPSGGDGWRNKLDVLLAYREYWQAIHREVSMLSEEDVIHVRCPANLSLLAVVYLTIIRKAPRRWIKYAGNWKPNSEPCSYRLQRWLLNSGWHGGTVTINGQWSNQRDHIYTFSNPSFELAELIEMQQVLSRKEITPPYQFVFPGRVETLKGIGQAIEICMLLHAKGIPFRLDIVGDGPERGSFEEIVIKKELDKYLIFHGWQSKTTLYKYHAQAHFILLPTSASEGWPKVLSEGMAYGVVPLAGAVSSIPQILKECKTGMALDPLNPQAFVDAILSYIHEPERWKRESVAAIQAAPRFTYEAYLEQLKIMFADYWDLKL